MPVNYIERTLFSYDKTGIHVLSHKVKHPTHVPRHTREYFQARLKRVYQTYAGVWRDHLTCYGRYVFDKGSKYREIHL